MVILGVGMHDVTRSEEMYSYKGREMVLIAKKMEAVSKSCETTPP
jgi:hypothetical protein